MVVSEASFVAFEAADQGGRIELFRVDGSLSPAKTSPLVVDPAQRLVHDDHENEERGHHKGHSDHCKERGRRKNVFLQFDPKEKFSKGRENGGEIDLDEALFSKRPKNERMKVKKRNSPIESCCKARVVSCKRVALLSLTPSMTVPAPAAPLSSSQVPSVVQSATSMSAILTTVVSLPSHQLISILWDFFFFGGKMHELNTSSAAFHQPHHH